MLGGERVLAVIAGRGGSKGLPRKNVRDLAGKPLIAWSIATAAQSRFLDRTVVSTDDPEIAETARRHGGDVPFMRPAELADDTASIVDAVLHAADNVVEKHRYVVLLQATSPLRLGSDIDGALEHCRRHGAPACLSITPAPKARWALEMDAAGLLRPLLESTNRRQELADAYQPNGAVYVAELEWLRTERSFYTPQTIGYVMPAERSVDIDTRMDFLLADAILRDQASK
jgi:N-acylneuraminate cytidylyltransferase